MRHESFRMSREEAMALLGRAEVLHLATTTREGEPVLRALDGVVLEEGIAFHGSRRGEKAACLGRPGVVSAEELVAHIPSHFTDPERACPASTFYRSAQVHGRLEELTDLAAKARALEALMARWQPEGGHRPLDPEDPLYRGEIDGVLVFRVSLDRVDGKAKLGQNRSPDDLRRILSGLWKRGQPADPAAIEAIEATTKHDVIAFLTHIEQRAGEPAGDIVHREALDAAGEIARALHQDLQQGHGEARPSCDCGLDFR